MHARAAKTALRDQLLTARRRIPLTARIEIAQALASLAEVEAVRRAASVTLYVSVGSEPGTGPLRERLLSDGKRVLLPVLRPDYDLDWAVYEGEAALVTATRGLLEPEGRRLGPEAIAGCDVVIVPGLAVSPTGMRMGKGGGCYDRALSRVTAGTPSIVLLHDDEVGLDVPAEPHDRPVTAAYTPSGLHPFPLVG